MRAGGGRRPAGRRTGGRADGRAGGPAGGRAPAGGRRRAGRRASAGERAGGRAGGQAPASGRADGRGGRARADACERAVRRRAGGAPASGRAGTGGPAGGHGRGWAAAGGRARSERACSGSQSTPASGVVGASHLCDAQQPVPALSRPLWVLQHAQLAFSGHRRRAEVVAERRTAGTATHRLQQAPIPSSPVALATQRSNDPALQRCRAPATRSPTMPHSSDAALQRRRTQRRRTQQRRTQRRRTPTTPRQRRRTSEAARFFEHPAYAQDTGRGSAPDRKPHRRPSQPGTHGRESMSQADMRIAIIDIGTNSTRLLIADVQGGRIVAELERETRVTRLGAGVDAAGKLAPGRRSHGCWRFSATTGSESTHAGRAPMPCSPARSGMRATARCSGEQPRGALPTRNPRAQR